MGGKTDIDNLACEIKRRLASPPHEQHAALCTNINWGAAACAKGNGNGSIESAATGTVTARRGQQAAWRVSGALAYWRGKGVMQGYTEVAAVDDKHQVVVHAQAYGSGSEQEVLPGMLEELDQRLRKHDRAN